MRESVASWVQQLDFDQLETQPFSCYIHVPFCTVRCGYCDFNTYLARNLGPNAEAEWLQAVHREIDLAGAHIGGKVPAISTIFFGGGTPSLILPAELGGVVDHLREAFGIADEAEITTEANPESLDETKLDQLLAAGINRLSIGMQSGEQAVLDFLERKHRLHRPLELVGLAKRAGFKEISLDLIYGSPVESLEQWQRSVEMACSVEPSHISAYALVIEPGTALGAKLRRGEIPAVDEDLQAAMYMAAEEILTAHGYRNYEISNWSLNDEHRARHNMAYWLSHNWWGFGPGAHSHLSGVRWWNVKLPGTYALRLSQGEIPLADIESLDADTRRIERVLLELRLAEGISLELLTGSERQRLAGFSERGLLELDAERCKLSLQGRLLADMVIRDLLD